MILAPAVFVLSRLHKCSSCLYYDWITKFSLYLNIFNYSTQLSLPVLPSPRLFQILKSREQWNTLFCNFSVWKFVIKCTLTDLQREVWDNSKKLYADSICPLPTTASQPSCHWNVPTTRTQTAACLLRSKGCLLWNVCRYPPEFLLEVPLTAQESSAGAQRPSASGPWFQSRMWELSLAADINNPQKKEACSLVLHSKILLLSHNSITVQKDSEQPAISYKSFLTPPLCHAVQCIT